MWRIPFGFPVDPLVYRITTTQVCDLEGSINKPGLTGDYPGDAAISSSALWTIEPAVMEALDESGAGGMQVALEVPHVCGGARHSIPSGSYLLNYRRTLHNRGIKPSIL